MLDNENNEQLMEQYAKDNDIKNTRDKAGQWLPVSEPKIISQI